VRTRDANAAGSPGNILINRKSSKDEVDFISQRFNGSITNFNLDLDNLFYHTTFKIPSALAKTCAQSCHSRQILG
jgi:hypothetical protein